MSDFVHLRMHTEFSITEGILRINDAIMHAQNNAMLALAITDLHNMFGVVKFYQQARAVGIKPIIGCELNVQGAEFNYRIIVLAKNYLGYKKICQLISRSFTENKILDLPYVKEEWLLASVESDYIVLSGGNSGDIGILLKQNEFERASHKARLWQQTFTDNYFIELQRCAYDYNELIFKQQLVIANQLAIPVVATCPIQFATAADYLAHEVRVCIATGQLLDGNDRQTNYSADQYFKTPIEMAELFADIPSAIGNSIEIAKKCNLEITLGEYFLPNYQTPNDQSLEEYLSNTANKGLEQRLIELFPEEAVRAEKQLSYRNRLQSEIEMIIQMGFAGYFLIVADFINWAKQHNVPVGPGRGSGAGSLVAYSLGITDVDPIHYGLLFERFLNPDRVSMPDFDIDFCQERRELVINYVQEKYGTEAVAQIATFGTMSSKAVIKDVGRVLGLPYGLCDSISKMILNTPAKSWGLLEAYSEFPELKQRIDNADDELRRLWEMSLRLENLARNVGKHAAGVLIAPSQMTDFCPIYLADGMQTSQLDKDDVEQIGLVKFDFLGLRNLTIIQEALENIAVLHNKQVLLSNSDFSDELVYKLMQKGNTTAIFQLESPGMKRLLVKLEPNRFEDVVAVLALYRPGPLGSGMVDDFVKRKKGEAPIDYLHPDLRECLDTTYGVIVYQEQVMQISQIIGGYSLGGADLLRRAMGKKKPEEMDQHRNIFVDGALKKGYTRVLAEKLFDLMAMFAEYGFNKSHSVAYAVISYHTAYLKAHYPACFMAATLSSELDKTDKLYEFYQDCIDNNLTILPPDINNSTYRFKAINETTIRYALGALKGVGSNVVEMIINERELNGDFNGLIDFCRRMDKKVINRKTLESLIKAGAFDSLEPNRAKLYHNLNKVIEFIEQEKNNANQGSLFDGLFDAADGDVGSALYDVELEDYPVFTLKEQLHLEKQAIGYYISGSLFDEYHDISKKLGVYPLAKFSRDDEEIQELINSRQKPKPKLLVCGIINYMGSRPTKKGGRISFIRIEDASGELEFVVFNEEYNQYKQLLKIDELVFVYGEVIYDGFRDEVKVTASQIMHLDEILRDKVTVLELDLLSTDNWAQIKALLQIESTTKDSIGTAIKLNYSNEQAKCVIKLGDTFKCQLDYAKLDQLSGLITKDRWRLVVG